LQRKYRIHIGSRFVLIIALLIVIVGGTGWYISHGHASNSARAITAAEPAAQPGTVVASIPVTEDLTGPASDSLAADFGFSWPEISVPWRRPPATRGVPEAYSQVYDPRVSLEAGDGGELGPLPPRRQVTVKGIYLTGYTAGNPQDLDALIKLVQSTELNTMVINVKDDDGRVTYKSSLPEVQAVRAATNQIRDIKGLLDQLHAAGIYVIARIVTFKDPPLARAHPDWSVQSKNGGLWYDRRGLAWVDPSNQYVWQYNIALAKEAAMLGFDEIQFDYVRFPTDGPVDLAVFPGMNGHDKTWVISSFLQQVRRVLGPMGVPISADVFGLTTAAADDMRIGQHLEDVARYTDYVSPMVYPSHYGPYNYGLPDPDAQPYQTVLRGVGDAVRRLRFFTAQVRPWLQDFTLRHQYGPAEVRAEIEAAYQAGAREWLLWNAANHYTEAALAPKQAVSPQAAGAGP